MDEITVTIPLSLLSGAETLTPEGIKAALADTTRVRSEANFIRDAYNRLSNDVTQLGQQLQHVVDSDMNIMEKFSAFRQLASEAQQLGRSVIG